MNWQEYEKYVFENIKDSFPNAVCIFNSKILGKYSKGTRQCDVLVKQNINGKEHLILIDAKYYSKKIDVKSVEDFIGMSNDVNADEGILVTPHGYTKLAYYRAENDPSQILLDILTLKQLKNYQGYCAIPYAGNHAVLLSPAFGWVIDGRQMFRSLALSYRKGFDFDKAFAEKELIYFNIWNTKEDKLTVVKLFENQIELLSESSNVLESNIENVEVDGKKLTTRKTIIENYISPEYACAIEYPNFIFFGVLLSENNRESVNFNKLKQMISKTLPIKVKHSKKTTHNKVLWLKTSKNSLIFD
jgi:hypothetical protein